jgi:large subunit ribosomal protein L21
VPSSNGSLTAVVVSGGKQYRVASGDRILVDRLAVEPGAELQLDRVLMIADADSIKVGPDALAGQVVTVRVLAHRRGPKIDVLRYKSKKRVRVHRGSRADLTALEVLSVGPPRKTGKAAEETADGEAAGATAARKPAARGRTRAAKPTPEPVAEETAAEETAGATE